jgi:perosamine synthetase
MTDDFIKVASPQVGEEEANAVRDVLLSGNYVSGTKVKEFEKRFAQYIGVKHAMAVSSGTAALCIALQAMGIGRGDEVIVPPFSFFATISSVLFLGAIPVFADIDLENLCLSPKSTVTKITSKTKAIIPVHVFGAPAKMNEFTNISKTYKIPILEDCAQAHGTEYGGQKVGSFGEAGAFSFFATKHITTGEGGMITTNDSDIAKACKIIRNHGMTSRDTHEVLGYNNRMTEMEAAMGLVQLKKLDRLNQKRIENSKYLIRQLASLRWARIPLPQSEMLHTFFWCPLWLDEEKNDKTILDLKQHLTKNEIGFRHRYNEPLYKQAVLKKLGLDYSDVYLRNVEQVAGNIIGLPNHPGLTKKELDRIIDVLKSF